jgi:hypothetical protein
MRLTFGENRMVPCSFLSFIFSLFFPKMLVQPRAHCAYVCLLLRRAFYVRRREKRERRFRIPIQNSYRGCFSIVRLNLTTCAFVVCLDPDRHASYAPMVLVTTDRVVGRTSHRMCAPTYLTVKSFSFSFFLPSRVFGYANCRVLTPK